MDGTFIDLTGLVFFGENFLYKLKGKIVRFFKLAKCVFLRMGKILQRVWWGSIVVPIEERKYFMNFNFVQII